MSELLIAASSITHLAVHVKVRRLEYKLLYYESAVLLAAGLLSMMSVLTLKNSLVDNEGIFYTVIGSSVKGSLFPLEPVDLVFMGLGLGGSTILLDFLTRFAGGAAMDLRWSISLPARVCLGFQLLGDY